MALQRGETTKFRPRGTSMIPLIHSGQLVTVEPLGARVLAVGDIVLCKVDGRQYLHLVRAIGSDGRYQIANNRGGINGWCPRDRVYGVVVKVED